MHACINWYHASDMRQGTTWWPIITMNASNNKLHQTWSEVFILCSPVIIQFKEMTKQYVCVVDQSGDEPPHQICSYTLLFLLFLRFLYIADPPLCTSAPTWLHAIALALTWQSHLLHWTDLAYLMDIWLTIHMYLLLFLFLRLDYRCVHSWHDFSVFIRIYIYIYKIN